MSTSSSFKNKKQDLTKQNLIRWQDDLNKKSSSSTIRNKEKERQRLTRKIKREMERKALNKEIRKELAKKEIDKQRNLKNQRNKLRLNRKIKKLDKLLISIHTTGSKQANIAIPKKVYFSTTVPITYDDLLNSKIIDTADFKVFFTNPKYFMRLINYIKNKEIDESLSKSKHQMKEKDPNPEIIKHNINLILDILFDSEYFHLHDKEYKIKSYKWDKKFNKKNDEKNSYKINVILDIITSQTKNCRDKKKAISKNWKTLKANIFKKNDKKNNTRKNILKGEIKNKRELVEKQEQRFTKK